MLSYSLLPSWQVEALTAFFTHHQLRPS